MTTVQLPELKPWYLVAAAAGAAVAYAYVSDGAKATLKLQVGGGQPDGPTGLPWSADHGCCPVTWPKTGRHSKLYPKHLGPNINALMTGSPPAMGMGLTSWMAAPPSEETT